jgi:hypothetical protein
MVLSWLFWHCCLVVVFMFQPSCQCCHVLAVLSSLSCPTCPILTVFSGFLIPAVLYRLFGPSCLAPALHIVPGYFVPPVLSVSCSDRLVLSVLSQMPCPGSPVLADLYLLSCLLPCLGCPVMSLYS